MARTSVAFLLVWLAASLGAVVRTCTYEEATCTPYINHINVPALVILTHGW